MLKPRSILLAVCMIGLALWMACTVFAGESEKPGKAMVKIRRRGKDWVEIEVSSERFFPVTNAAAVLHVGAQQTSLSGYPKDGSLYTLIFSMDAKDFALTRNGDPITVDYSPDSQEPWDFGLLDKTVLTGKD